MATRNIELYNITWDCPDCGNTSTNGVKYCRKCGKEKPVYGVLDSKANKSSQRQVKARQGESFAVSTLKMKDGRNAEDIKRERNK